MFSLAAPLRVDGFFFSSRRRHTRFDCDWSSDVCSSDLYTPGLVVRYVVENLVWLALGLPLALWGLACHALPYWLTGKTVALLGRTAEEEATDKMAAGLVLYPMCWALEAWLVWRPPRPPPVPPFLPPGVPPRGLGLAGVGRIG